MVLTKASADKYFGDENPIGKVLTLDNKIDVVVTGVTENVPKNSSIRYDFLVSMETANVLYDWMNDWKVNNQAALLLLSEGYYPDQLEEKLSTIINKYYSDSPESPKRLYLFPLLDFFLNSREIDSYWASGGANFIVLWFIAVLLLIIACINFMNLATARYGTRANEVGMRKVVGAHRKQLIFQFLGESVTMTVLALLFSILIILLVLPAFQNLMERPLDFNPVANPLLFGGLVLLVIFVGLFAGSYPAMSVSGFKPITVLSGVFSKSSKGKALRNILVVFQFSITIIRVLRMSLLL